MRLVLPARALSFFGDSIAFVVISLKIAESDKPVLMTVMLIAFSLPLFVLAPLAGRAVDEHDSRKLLVAGGSLQVVASFGLVMSPNVASMVGCVLLLQTGQSVTGPSWAALVPRIVGDDLVGKAVGLQQSLAGLAGLAGAAVGGVLFDVLGYHKTLIIDTGTFAALAVVGGLVQTRRGRRYDATTAPVEGSAPAQTTKISGWQFIRQDSLLKLLGPALWLFVLSAEATNVVEIFLIRDDLGAPASIYGLTMAAFMLGQTAGPLLGGRVGNDSARVVWAAASAGAIGVLIVAIGLSPTVWAVIPLFVVVGVSGGALNALIGTLVVTRPPEQVRGRVLATLMGLARGFSVAAMVLGGLSGQFLGPRMTFVICGLVSGLVALLILRSRAGACEKSLVAATMEA